tara:strand:- start:483 stop:731 length:249 start_codon:yes stop_codon:yes gene_type:complete
MQKIVNVLAVASSVVSLAVVGSGLYVFVNRASIIDGVKSQVMDSVAGALGPAIGGALPDVTGGVTGGPSPSPAPPAGLSLPK